MYTKQYVNVCESCKRLLPIDSLDEDQKECLDRIGCDAVRKQELQNIIESFALRYNKTLKKLAE
jgi:hypothetical protein